MITVTSLVNTNGARYRVSLMFDHDGLMYERNIHFYTAVNSAAELAEAFYKKLLAVKGKQIKDIKLPKALVKKINSVSYRQLGNGFLSEIFKGYLTYTETSILANVSLTYITEAGGEYSCEVD